MIKARRLRPGTPPLDPHAPLVLAAPQTGGLRICARNPAARAAGIRMGELVSDAQARLPALQVRAGEHERDRDALTRLAEALTCFSPWAAPWPEDWPKNGGGDGITLDISGCSHLFGGEDAMAQMILEKLRGFGYSAHLAIADTQGAAYALAASGPKAGLVVPPGKIRAGTAPLPVEALRLDDALTQNLRRLGLKRIGDLLPLPRAPLAKRFGAMLLTRLDQLTGEADEPVSPLSPVPLYRSHARLAEPIQLEEHILRVTERLADALMRTLSDDGKGARRLRLLLYRVDGEVAHLEVTLAAPAHHAAHIVKLFALRLDTLRSTLDAGFGYDAMLLEAHDVAPLDACQTSFAEERPRADESAAAQLIDRLGTRLGIENVRRLYPHQSHIPERAVIARPAHHQGAAAWQSEHPLPLRPLLMLPAAEPAEVIAPLPEGPPRQFRWRGVRYAVTYSEGPERIRPEWWQRDRGDIRDYYIVEDEAGHRFWLYRQGIYGAGETPKWFVHGVFP